MNIRTTGPLQAQTTNKPRRPQAKIGTQNYPANPSLDSWAESSKFHSKPDFFRMAAKKNPDGNYVGARGEKDYEYRTYKQVEGQVEEFASGVINLGIKPGERMGIFATGSPDWRVADFGASYTGAVVVGMVAELPEERVEFVLQDSGSKAVMVDTAERLDKVMAAEKNLPELKTIIVSGDVDLKEYKEKSSKNIVTLNEVMEDGKASLEGNRKEMEQRIDDIGYNDIASMVYTSGSTGKPKGVLLSHGNVLASVQGTLQVVNSNPEETLKSARTDDVYPSVLPQGHVMGQVGDYAITASGGTIVYPESILAFSRDLRKIKPTVLAVTPLFLHKIHEGIEKKAMKQDKPVVSPFIAGLGAGAAGAALGGTIGAMVGGGVGGQAMQWGLGIAGAVMGGVAADRAATSFAKKMTGAQAFQSAVESSHEYYKEHGQHSVGQRVKHELAKKLVFKKVRSQVDRRLGGRTRAILSGGAPLGGEAETVMRAMGFGIAQGYGLAESSGGGMTNDPSWPQLGTGGAAQAGTEIRIGEGEEIQMRGPTIMSGGYLNRPDKTEGSFTDDGWYKTGDTGEIIESQGPFSMGKLAGLTAAGGGAGALISNALGQDPIIGAAVGGVASAALSVFSGAARTKGKEHFAITGRIKSQFKLPGGEYVTPEPIEASLQGSPFIARAMVSGAADRDLVGALVQPNFENLAEWAAKNDLPTEPGEMAKNPDIIKFLEQEAVDRSSSFRKHEVVRRLHVLGHELTGDEITAKGEVMRKVVTEKYASEIKGMFN